MRAERKGPQLGGKSALETVILSARDDLLSHIQLLEQNEAGGVFAEYQGKPVEFCTEILHENLTPDIENLMRTWMRDPRTFARSANGTGKSHAAARLVIFAYKCYKECKVYVFAAPPEDNLKKVLFAEIGRIIENNPALFADDDVSLPSMSIKRAEDQFIQGVTIPQSGDPAQRKAKFSGKHAPYLFFFGDEADAIPGDIIEAIESCVSGGFARELYLYNPRAQMGPMYMMEKNHEATIVELSAFTHPNVVIGSDIIPGAVTREVTVARINKWTRMLLPGEKIDTGCFMVPEFLVGYRARKTKDQMFPALPAGIRKITEPAFSYMVLGKYSSQAEDQLFNRADIELCMARWQDWKDTHGDTVPLLIKPDIGLDVADMGNDTTVFSPKYDYFIDTQLVFAKQEIPDTVDDAHAIAREKGVNEWWVDANGLGAAVCPLLERMGYTANRIIPMASTTEDAKDSSGEVIGQFERMRDQGYWAFSLWVKHELRACLPNDPELMDQLMAFTYIPNKRTGKIKVCDNDVIKERLGGKSPDKASSIMQLFCAKPDEDGAFELYSFNYHH